VPSVPERLATLEAEARELRADVEGILALIHGGAGVEWDRSLRGKLHELDAQLAAVVMRTRFGLAMTKVWVQAVILACAVATAAAAWYAALHH
jgi:hypothetical protein